MKTVDNPDNYDVVLVGAGIMSATLGVLIKLLDPTKSIAIYESLPVVASESSNVWNNAGTGHAALCELNYTPENSDGAVSIEKAIEVNQQFQISQQFWSYLVSAGHISVPEDFITSTAHMSWVQGADSVDFLKRRVSKLRESFLFSKTEFSDDIEKIFQWAPLLVEGKGGGSVMAATYNSDGTDVNFGSLTSKLFEFLQQEGCELFLGQEVKNLCLSDGVGWDLDIKDLSSGRKYSKKAEFVFIGAGGNAIKLLQKSRIKEAKGFGGFPVSGRFLRCNNPDFVRRHDTKVYGKPEVGSPPMSMPHLDRRVVEGKEELLFGPFAGFSPKFLKSGSFFDLPRSIKSHNLATMLGVGVSNFSLTKYLVKQVFLSKRAQMGELRKFVPTADDKDWDLVVAGQRVQIMKRDAANKSVLQFGTEVIHSRGGSLAALLGASPGASVSVSVMLDVLEACFPESMGKWSEKLSDMLPFYRGIQDLGEKDFLVEQQKIRTTLKIVSS